MGSTVYADTAGTTPATVGGTVARIDAAGGVAAQFTNATAAQRPILRADGLEYDGVDDYLSLPDNPALRFGTGSFTVAMAAFNSSLAGLSLGSIFSKRLSSPGYNFSIDRTTGRFRTVLQDTDETIIGYAGASNSWPVNAWESALVEVDRVANVVRHYQGGVYKSGFDLNIATLGDISSSAELSISVPYVAGLLFPFNGKIGRIIAIDKLIDAADKATVEAWLQGGFA